jgi:predicted permease
MNAEMDEEFLHHLELRTEHLIRSGLSPAEAARRARLEFGSGEHYREEGRAAVGLRRLDEFGGDLRYTARSLRKSPGFTMVAALTLALGIGATSALFSVVHAVLLRPLGYPEPEQIVRIHTLLRGEEQSDRDLSPPNFASLAEGSRAFVAISAAYGSDHILSGNGETRTVEGTRVSASFFDVMGVHPVLGRVFLPVENKPGNHRVVVLGHGLWQLAFGADPGVLGRAISLDGEPYTIVGVMPSGLPSLARSDVWVPIVYGPRYSATTDDGRYRNTWLPVFGRLRPGVTLERGQGDLRLLAERLAGAFPAANADVSFGAKPLHEEIVGDVRTPLLLLFGASLVVLLVACANVIGLHLARAGTREAEMSVRVALGAGRRRLIRQLLTESMVLGLLGGGLGLVVAVWATRSLAIARPQGIPRLETIRVDGAVLTFTFVVALAVSALAGLAPALRATRTALAGTLRESGRGSPSRRSHRLRGGLVIGQISLAIVLLTMAALLLQSFARLVAVDPGFETERVLSFRVDLPAASWTEPAVPSFYERLLEQLGRSPSIAAAGAVSRLPIAQGSFSSRFSIEGRPDPQDEQQSIGVLSITPGYFRALSIPVLHGRGISEQDRASAVPVVVINEAAATRFFPGENPIGRQLVQFSYDPIEQAAATFTVVGVVADIRGRALNRAPAPEAFFAHAQVPFPGMNVVVNTSVNATTLSADIRSALAALDPNLPPPALQSMDGVLAASVARPRYLALLLTLFALLTHVLAAVGVFGLLSYTVAQRTREIGVRVALGAHPHEVLSLIIRRALVMSGLGVVLGLAGALVLTRLLENQLFGIRPADPVAYAAAAALMTATALLAAWVPARRAASVDPIHALRQH